MGAQFPMRHPPKRMAAAAEVAHLEEGAVPATADREAAEEWAAERAAALAAVSGVGSVAVAVEVAILKTEPLFASVGRG